MSATSPASVAALTVVSTGTVWMTWTADRLTGVFTAAVDPDVPLTGSNLADLIAAGHAIPGGTTWDGRATAAPLHITARGRSALYDATR